MKRFLYFILGLIITSITNYCFAVEITYDYNDIQYVIDTENSTADVSRLTKLSTNLSNLVIPNTIIYNQEEIPVVRIRENAFLSRINLTGSLTIGDNVKSIGYRAFYRCGFNGKIQLGKNLEIIEEEAFYYCSGFTGSLNLSDNITYIGNSAFAGCSGFNGELILSKQLDKIEPSTFSGCNNFTGNLIIPERVTHIGAGAFYECENFTGDLKIPDLVIEIGTSAFSGCYNFDGTLYLGKSLEVIGAEAFGYCEKLNGRLVFPDKITDIGHGAFSYCENLTGPLEIPQNINEIKYQTFACCSNLTGSLIIPEKIIKIGYGAFGECGFTGSLTIGNSVKLIEDGAFSNCFGFNDCLTIGESVEQIGESAFYYTNFIKVVSTPEDPPVFRPTNAGDMYKGPFENSTYSNAILYVSPNSLNKYKSAPYWKNFKTINPDYNVPSSITIIPAQLNLFIGQTYNLSVQIEPQEIKEFDISWNSSNKSVVFVDDYGTVTAISEGIATITAICGEASATCKVTVNPVVASSITLNVQDITLLVGQTDKLTATVLPENTTDKTVIWESDNEAIATVGSDGTVTGVSVGNATITATCGEASATCKVTVNPVVASSITLNVQDITLLVGQTDKLTATVSPENTTDKTVTLTSDNEAIATVGADGTVTGVSVGIANLTATCGEASATCKVTVNPVEVSSIELSLQDVNLLIGSTTTLTAKVYPENATEQNITWSSSVPSIARVDDNGTITALQIGETTITATCGNASATCKVTVTPVSPSSIELNIKDMILYIGQSETIQAIVRPANTTYPTVTWQSGDEKVAIVTADGKVTGISEGVVTITASCGEVSAECTVTVNPIPASNIEITTGDVTLTIGNSTTLLAKVLPENTTHPEVEWVSSDPDIATITADGTVTGINIGTAIITANCGNVSATCTVTVIPVPSEGIIISPTSVSMLLGDELTLTASVFPENTSDKNITWGSDNPSVASVSSNGVVTALNLGTATITASNGSFKATCIVTVNPIIATSISLNVKDETIFVASTTQLVVTISPANVTDKTITWTSSKPEIATVTDDGLVYGVAVGTTTITATIGSVSTTCQINVVHRIPDMDPSVTTSDRDIKTISGKPVNMAVYPAGGEPTGWSYIWTKNGEIVSRSPELNITAINDSEIVIAEIYQIKVENEIDKVVIFSEVYDFVVQIYPDIDDNQDDIDIIISTGNGTSNKTREGNRVILSVNTPSGGNPQGWEYLWSDERGEIGNEESVEAIASMSYGNSMAVEETTYKLKMTNYSPDGDVWAQINVESNLQVYRRPVTPLQLLRKGNGTSHTFIVMMPLSDFQLEQFNYCFVYGWTNSDDNDHISEQSKLRYCHIENEIYNNPANKFWAYDIWNYTDGSVVSSGLRYLDGSSDESFDASVFNGSTKSDVDLSDEIEGIYTTEGRFVGKNLRNLEPGIYIVRGKTSATKIIIN